MNNAKNRKEIYQEYNTLASVPHVLLNMNTMIDLRNETTVAGTIEHVDGYTILHI